MGELTKLGFEIEFLTKKTREELLSSLSEALYNGDKTKWQYARVIVDGEEKKRYFINDRDGNRFYIVTDKSCKGREDEVGYELVCPPIFTFDYKSRYKNPYKVLCTLLSVLIDNGCFVNETCGIHVHLDAPKDGKILVGWIRTVLHIQGNIRYNFGISDYRILKYCKLLPVEFNRKFEKLALRRDQNIPIEEMVLLYHDILSEGVKNWRDPKHPSRYYLINLNSLYIRNTVELRWFNSSLSIYTIHQYIDYIKSHFY